MRDGWKSRWGWRVSAVVLVGGVLVLGSGTVVAQASDFEGANNQQNPFQRILDKLDKILHALKSNGGQGGNHTLRWDQNLPAAQRFVVLATFNNEAVLDKNTGLVWEQAPDVTPTNWFGAALICVNKTVGGTVGWRLPSVAELRSVQDPTLPPPFVPTSIFTGVQLNNSYWSSSTDSSDGAWTVAFNFNKFIVVRVVVNGFLQVWCVRGGMNADRY